MHDMLWIRRHPRCRAGHGLTRSLGALWLACCALPTAPLRAGPTGGTVIAGDASIATAGTATTITAGDRSVLRWGSFDVGANESVRFIQPGIDARVLNWIGGNAASQIDGTLLANGQVYLVNPAGVYFGRTALVEVGRLYAVAGSMSREDFLAGFDRFTALSGDARNAGTLRGASIALIGRTVANTGSIVAPDGIVALAAGGQIVLGRNGSSIYVDAGPAHRDAAATITATPGVSNSGTIDVGHGTAVLAAGDLYAVAITHEGKLVGGDVKLQGQGPGDVVVSGAIEAYSGAAREAGGHVEITGERVALRGSATVDASGPAGGGTILIGGDYQGSNPAVRNASGVAVMAGARLNADATVAGDGGKVVVWSDGVTRFGGAVSARGGSSGGNGGFVEISGRQRLGFGGQVDTRAPFGTGGMLLLDPTTLTIEAGADDGLTAEPTVHDGTINHVLLTTNLTLSASDSLLVQTGVSVAWTTAQSLTLHAANDIVFQAGSAIAGQSASSALQFEFGGLLDLTAAPTLKAGSITASGGGSASLQGPNAATAWTLTGANAGSITSGSITAGTAGMTFTGVSTVAGGTANDLFTLATGVSTFSGTVAGGGGANTLAATDGANTWTVTAMNEGALNGTTVFSGITTAKGGTGTDTITASRDATLTLIDTKLTVGGVEELAFTGMDAAALEGGAGSNTIDVSGWTKPVQVHATAGADTVTGNGANTTLVGPDTDNTWVIDTANHGTLNGTTTFTAVQNLTGGSSNDTFGLQTGGSISGTIAGGGGLLNTLDYGARATAIAVAVTGPKSGHATDVGSFAGIDEVTGSTNPANTLTGPNVVTSWSLTGPHAGTVDGIRFTQIATLTGGTNDDTFTLGPGVATFDGAIDGGGGTDTVAATDGANAWAITGPNAATLNGTTTFAAVTKLAGGSGDDTLTGLAAGNAWTITAPGAVTVAGLDAISMDALVGGAGDDTFTLNAGVPSFGGSITGGGGADTLAATDGTNAWAVTAVHAGTLNGTTVFSEITTAKGGTGTDTIVASRDANLTLVDTKLTVGGVDELAFTGMDAANLQGGAGNDVIDVSGWTKPARIRGTAGTDTVTGNGANTTLVGPDTDNAWMIDAANHGTLNATTTFTAVQNLTGGLGHDTFGLQPGGSVTGTISGGGGLLNTLDYGACNTAVALTVTGATAGQVTDVGSFTGIDQVTGSTNPANTVTGPNAVTSWSLTGSHAGAVDGISFTGMATLTGGTSADTFKLASGVATFAGAIAGGGGADELAATDGTNTWAITAANAGTLNVDTAFSGIAKITGGAGADTISVHRDVDITLTDTTLTVAATEVLALAGMDVATLEGGNGANHVDVSGWGAAKSARVQATGGIDTVVGNGANTILIGQNVSNAWSITAPNGGTLNAATAFTAIGKLGGGAGDDVFELHPGGSIAGIDGGGGAVNRLDYSSRPTAISVSLSGTGAGNGTDVAGFTGIDHVTAAGNPANTLTGPNAVTDWTLTGAGTGNVAGVLFSGIPNLSGGANNDTFTFAPGVSTFAGQIAGGGGSNAVRAADLPNTWTITGPNQGTLNVSTVFSGIATLGGGAGTDTLLGPSSDTTWRITGAKSVAVAGMAAASMDLLVGGAAADAFTLDSGVATFDGQIDGGDGANRLAATSGANQWTLTAAQQGTLNTSTGFARMQTLAGGTGADTLNNTAVVKLSADNAGSAEGADPNRPTAFSGMDTLNSGGAFTLTGTALVDTFVIDGANSGTVRNLRFNGYSVLNGGDGDDTFTLSGGTVTAINGDAGRDTLNQAGDVTLSGDNAGKAKGAVDFAGIEALNSGGVFALTGTNQPDSFTVAAANAGTVRGIDFSGYNVLNGGAGNDAVNILHGGLVGGMSFNGGDGIDVIAITDTSLIDDVAYRFVSATDGSIAFGPATFTYTGVDSIGDALAVKNRSFNYSDAAEGIAIGPGATAGMTMIGSSLGTLVSFANPTVALTVNAGGGNDAFGITGVGTGFAAAITVDGGPGNLDLSGIAGLPPGQNLTVLSQGDVTDSATITVPGQLSVTTSGAVASIVLGDTTTANFGSLILTGPTVNVTEGSDMLVTSAAADALTLKTSAGEVKILTAKVTNLLSVTSAAGTTLASAPTATTLGSVTSGSMNITAGGDVADEGAIAVSGAASFDAGTHSILLGDTTTANFGSLALRGGTVNVTEASEMLVTNASAGTLTLKTTAGAVDVGVANISGAAVINSAAGTRLGTVATDTLLVNAGGDVVNYGALSSNGAAAFNAGSNSITLGEAAAANFGTIAVTGGTVTVTEGSPMQVTSANAGTLTLRTNSGPVDIDSASVSGALTVNSSGGTNLGSVGAGSLTVNAGGEVTDDGAVSIGGAAVINAGGSGITLGDTTTANFGSLTLTGGAVRVTEGSAMQVNTATATDLTLTAAGGSMDLGAATVANTLTIASAGGVDFGAVKVGGNLLLNAAGDVTDRGTLTVTGTSAFSALGHTVILDTAANDFRGSVRLTAAAATLVDANALDLGLSEVAGDLHVTASGPITDSGDLAIGGAGVFSAGTNAITLGDGTTANFGTLALNGGRAAVTEASAMHVTTASIGSDLTLKTTTGAVEIDRATVGAGLTVTSAAGADFGAVSAGSLGVSAAGDVTDSGTLAITGATVVDAGTHAITLGDTTTANFGTLKLKGGTVSVTEGSAMNVLGANAATLDLVTSSGEIQVQQAAVTGSFHATSAAGVTLGSGDVAVAPGTITTGDLTLGAHGAVRQAGAISVTRATVIDSGGGDVSLALAANDFSTVSVRGGTVDLADANALRLTAVTASGGVAVTTSDALTIAGDLTGAAAISLRSTHGDVALSAPAGSGLAVSAGGTLTLQAGKGVAFGANTRAAAVGDLATDASGGDLLMDPGSTLSVTGSGQLSLHASGNADLATVSTAGGATTIQIGGATRFLNALAVNGPFTVTSGAGGVLFTRAVDGAGSTQERAVTTSGASATAAPATADLTVNTAGVTTFAAGVGGTRALNSVTTDAAGTTAINGGAVTTVGSQTYGDAVSLGADTVLSSTNNGAITLAAVDGPATLTVNTGGTTTFGGAVGGSRPLSAVAADAAGTTVLSGGQITTSGAQVYNDPVTLGATETLTSTGGGAVTFASTLNGAQTLTVNSAGTTTFARPVGSTTPLAGLNTDAVGSTAINGGSVTTSGTQAFNDAVTLGADTTLTSTAGDLKFGQTVGGAGRNLVATSASGTFTAAGTLGGADARLQSVSAHGRNVIIGGDIWAEKDILLAIGSGAGTAGSGGTANDFLQFNGTDETVVRDTRIDSASGAIVLGSGAVSGSTEKGGAPLRSSIFKKNNGDLLLFGQNVEVKPNERLAVSHGSLVVIADGTGAGKGTITLTNTAVSNYLVLVSSALPNPTNPGIRFESRGPAAIDLGKRNPSGQDHGTDLGTDLVAGAVLLFNSNFSVAGGVPTRTNFKPSAVPGPTTDSGLFDYWTHTGNIPANLGLGAVTVLPDSGGATHNVFLADLLTTNSFRPTVPSLVYLDLSTAVGFGEFRDRFINFDADTFGLTDVIPIRTLAAVGAQVRSAIEQAFTPPVPREDIEGAQAEADLSAAVREQLQALGIYARALTEAERRSRVRRAGLFTTVPARERPREADYEVADARVEDRAVRQVIRAAEDTGLIGAGQERLNEVARSLAIVFGEFGSVQPTGGGGELRAWLETRTDADARRVLDFARRVQGTLQQIERLGLTRRELEGSKAQIYGSVLSSRLNADAEFLRALVEGLPARPPVSTLPESSGTSPATTALSPNPPVALVP